MTTTLRLVRVGLCTALAGRYVPQWIESDLGTVEVVRLVFATGDREFVAEHAIGATVIGRHEAYDPLTCEAVVVEVG